MNVKPFARPLRRLRTEGEQETFKRLNIKQYNDLT